MASSAKPNSAFVTQASQTREDLSEAIRKRKLSQDGDSKEEEAKNDGDIDITEHNLDLQGVLDKFDVTLNNGLNDDQVQDRHNTYGDNLLTPPDANPWYCLLLHEMTGFFSLLLWLAAALCYLAYILDNTIPDNLYLGIVLTAVTWMTGCFSFYQEYKSAAIMEGFKSFLPQTCNVKRNGKVLAVDAVKLVPGDVVLVKAGDAIPADLRVMEATDFKVDNSSLTGESDAQTRTNQNSEENPMEATNLAFFGTNCAKGKATGIVIKIGDGTLIGSIAKLASSTSTVKTPIAIEIEHFIHIVSSVAVFLGVSFLIIGIIRKEDPITNLVFMIGIIVANVPEGLLATVTVSLTLTAQRMAKKNVLVKNLEAVETLGSTTVIASDKTGTLTQNRMTAVELYMDLQTFPISTQEEMAAAQEAPSFDHAMRIMALCNNACFEQTPENMFKDIQQRDTVGDASESALLKFCEHVLKKKGSTTVDFRNGSPKIGEIPFNSTNKYQVSVHLPNAETECPRMLVMKGAPERIWTICSQIIVEGKVINKGLEHKANFDANINEMMFKGERVLGLCYANLDQDEYEVPDTNADGGYRDCDTYDPSKDNLFGRIPYDPASGNELSKSDIQLVFVGLIALIDPPRPTVPKAVLSCQKAGIKVVMVTGDHPETAESIARKVYIIRDKTQRDVAREYNIPLSEVHAATDARVSAIVIPGKTLATLTPEELDNYLDYDQIVFARTSPAQKLKIVEGLQRKKFVKRGLDKPKPVKHVVAVTGDGVNDSPALKAADIGVAMGIAGTQVAKDAADMILLDDNFASIVNGVEEGRLIFDNLKKSIAYTLSSNIPEISPFLVFILVAVPLPLPTILILCIDLGTDMVPAISLAYEGREANIMIKPPRDARVDRLVTAKLVCFSYLQVGVVQAAAGFYCWCVVLKDFGFSPSMLPGVYWAFEKESATCILNPKDPVFSLWQNQSIDYKTAVIPKRHRCGFAGETLGNDFAAGQSWFNSGVGYTTWPDRIVDMVNGSIAYAQPAKVWTNGGEKIDKEGWIMFAKSSKLPKFSEWGYVGEMSKCNVVTDGSGYDHNGICWNAAEALMYAQTVYFICIIIVQWSDILACKTRTLSLVDQGMRNNMLTFGLFFETALGALLCYVPPFQTAFSTRPIYFVHWLAPFPFAIFILSYDEIRKVLMRQLSVNFEWFKPSTWIKTPAEGAQPKNWVWRNTYY
jgi:sodium/potassium-transporting ATPase subunit alpha